MTQDDHDRTVNEDESRATPTVRDRRRIDPLTGMRRDVDGAEATTPGVPPPADGAESRAQPQGDPQEQASDTSWTVPDTSAELDAAKAQAAEHLDDLRRLQAEFVNYRRRVERDRVAVREGAQVDVLSAFLPILDDIGRARDHGDLEGAFKSVAESVEATTARLGLIRFGEVGDPFDPTIHEALMHEYADDVDGPVCREVLQAGYRVGDRIVRAARVAVAEPGSPPDAAPAGE